MSEPNGRGAAWTEERGRSDEGRRRLEAPRRREANRVPRRREASTTSSFFEPEIETMPRAGIAALQEERILELVPYVYERSALVRKKWEQATATPSDVNSLADFTERAPLITKYDIRQFRARAQDPLGRRL